MLEIDSTIVEKLMHMGFNKFYVSEDLNDLVGSLKRKNNSIPKKIVVAKKGKAREYLGENFVVNAKGLTVKTKTKTMAIVNIMSPFHGELIIREFFLEKLMKTFNMSRTEANKWVGNCVKCGLLTPVDINKQQAA